MADAAWERLLVMLVFSLPALAGGAWMAWGLRRPAAVALLSVVGGLVLVLAAAVALAADLPARPGPFAATALGSLTLLLAVVPSRRRPR